MPVRKNTSRIKTVSIAADNYACVRSVVWRLPQAGSPKPASTSKGTEMSATAAARPVEPEVRSDTSPSDVAALGRSSRVLLTGVAMAIPQDLPFDEWVRAGRRLSGIVDSSSWWLGDWLVHGKRHFATAIRWRFGRPDCGTRRCATMRGCAAVSILSDAGRG
jgi:hypothetical protein